MTADRPTPRPTARVLVLDQDDRVLLFRIVDADIRDAPWIWVAPGGGAEAGESEPETAARELWEETGAEAVLEGPVWRRRYVYPARGQWFEALEAYFVARVDAFVPDRSNHTPIEREDLREHRRWLVEEVLAAGEVFVPLGPRRAPPRTDRGRATGGPDRGRKLAGRTPTHPSGPGRTAGP